MAQMSRIDTPTTADYVSHFADQYAQAQRGRQAMDVENRRVDIEKQRADADRAFNEGQLGLAKSSAEDKRADAYFAEFIKTAVVPYDDGTPEGQAIAKRNIEAEMTRDPAHANLFVGWVQRLANQPTMADRTKANFGAKAEEISGRVKGGSTDPNDMNYFVHATQGADMPSYGFQHQEAIDLQNRGGGSVDAIPKPIGNAVIDSERRNTKAMTSAAENQASQTQIKTTAMGEAGATERARIQAAGNAASQRATEGQAIAAEIIAGRQPPVVNSRTLEGPVKAALAAEKYDLVKATQDWTATQKYMTTLNGAQQVRLRQAVDFAYESLGVVKDLAEQWKAGGFPLLNSARLVAAEQGALGPQAQALATKFRSQIVEMQSELSVVYRGGNSPTDESLKQAAKVLQTNWSMPTLLSNVDLLETNLRIRRNSIVTAGAAAGANNTYAPHVTLPPPPSDSRRAPQSGPSAGEAWAQKWMNRGSIQ